MFAKVFRQIFQSSIAEDPELRFTFMDLLVLADSDGVVDMTPESISRVTNRPLDIIKRTIGDLERADPRSRTPDCEGRRIRRLDDHRDWGWIIVNYDHFRRIASDDQRREKTRSRVAKFRENRSRPDTCSSDSHPVTPCNACNAMDLPLPLLLPDPAFEERGTGGRVKIPPSLGEVKTIGAEIGIPDNECEKFWHHFESNGWRVGGKAPMKNVRSALFSWKSRMQGSAGALGSLGKPVSAPPAGIQLRAVTEEVSKHPANRESVYFDRRHTEAQRVHLQQLRARAAELNRQVANGGAQ